MKTCSVKSISCLKFSQKREKKKKCCKFVYLVSSQLPICIFELFSGSFEPPSPLKEASRWRLWSVWRPSQRKIWKYRKQSYSGSLLVWSRSILSAAYHNHFSEVQFAITITGNHSANFSSFIHYSVLTLSIECTSAYLQ